MTCGLERSLLQKLFAFKSAVGKGHSLFVVKTLVLVFDKLKPFKTEAN
jgi:hypothetical protein